MSAQVQQVLREVNVMHLTKNDFIFHHIKGPTSLDHLTYLWGKQNHPVLANNFFTGIGYRIHHRFDVTLLHLYLYKLQGDLAESACMCVLWRMVLFYIRHT